MYCMCNLLNFRPRYDYNTFSKLTKKRPFQTKMTNQNNYPVVSQPTEHRNIPTDNFQMICSVCTPTSLKEKARFEFNRRIPSYPYEKMQQIPQSSSRSFSFKSNISTNSEMSYFHYSHTPGLQASHSSVSSVSIFLIIVGFKLG